MIELGTAAAKFVTVRLQSDRKPDFPIVNYKRDGDVKTGAQQIKEDV